VPFEARPADVEELTSGEPEAVAVENARRKAAAVDGDLVLGVDTIVALDGAIYGKPADEQQAKDTLRALSGRTHQVVSGLAVNDRTAVAVTDVTFRALDDAVIDRYVATGEWRERAGGYAIQGRGAALVREIRGDYLNVVGLPAAALLDLLPGLAICSTIGAARAPGAHR
jgi:septum formation protein